MRSIQFRNGCDWDVLSGLQVEYQVGSRIYILIFRNKCSGKYKFGSRSHIDGI